MLIDIIAGARPNFMKIAPIIEALDEAKKRGAAVSYRLIHTGQHYDKKLSDTFFSQLNIPAPDVNFGVGSGTHATQTANIMIKYEELLLEKRSELVIVVGDVNSTMACAIVAKKLGVKVAHVEAGIRSFDLSMPEEINRMVTDSITDYFFTTTRSAGKNLTETGVSEERIFFVGNTMIDTLLKNLKNLEEPSFWNTINLQQKKYLVTTLHRPSNVDDSQKLKKLLHTIAANAQKLPVIFPVHPRTKKNIITMELPENIFLTEPLSYFEFIYLLQYAKAVVTDSGGIQEETTVLKTPCITLRDNTERPETVTVGTNELIGTDPKNIEPWLKKLFNGQWKKGDIPEKWDGKTGQRIVQNLVGSIK